MNRISSDCPSLTTARWRSRVTRLAPAILLAMSGSHVCQAESPFGLTPVSVQIDDTGRVEMRDASDGTPLLMPRALPPHVAGNSNAITPAIGLKTRFGGFDLQYRFFNDTNETRPLGMIMLGIFTLGEPITTYNFRRSGEPMQAFLDDGFISYGGKTRYPTQMYSPVGVLANDRYAIGVSIQYPVLDWKHEVEWSLRSPRGDANRNGEGGPGWAVGWKLSNLGTESERARLQYPAELGPGEHRTYTISVRVTKRADEWMRTLTPYRSYFRSMYGHVAYSRDATPIKQESLAGEWEIGPRNPYGMTNPHRRPDIHGWQPWAEYLAGLAGDWNRVVLWKPSGVYAIHRHDNYPFLFTTHWHTGNQEGHHMGDATEWLPTVRQAGVQLGLWWGNSTVVHFAWDDGRDEPLDPLNPDHRARAFRELDIAQAAGATIIGLDNFNGANTPMWTLYQWLSDMQARYPNMIFATESRKPDILHRFAPTIWRAFKRPGNIDWPVDDISELYAVTTPLYLADFLLAGHETWCFLDTDALNIYYGRETTETEYHEQVLRIASLGYVPVVATPIPPGPAGHAAETWWTTVPRDLLELPE